MIHRIAFVLSFAVLLAGAGAHAQALLEPPPPAPPAPSAQAEAIGRMNSIPALMAQGQQYQQAGDWASYALVLQRLITLRPFLGVLRYELAAAYAMQDMKPESYDSLVRLQGSGYAYDIAADQRFKNVHGTELWTFLVENFSNNGRQFGSGKVVATLPKGDNLLRERGLGSEVQQLPGRVGAQGHDRAHRRRRRAAGFHRARCRERPLGRVRPRGRPGARRAVGRQRRQRAHAAREAGRLRPLGRVPLPPLRSAGSSRRRCCRADGQNHLLTGAGGDAARAGVRDRQREQPPAQARGRGLPGGGAEPAARQAARARGHRRRQDPVLQRLRTRLVRHRPGQREAASTSPPTSASAWKGSTAWPGTRATCWCCRTASSPIARCASRCRPTAAR